MINLTDNPLKFQIGSTTINLEPYGEEEINLKHLEHIKKPVMRRALNILKKFHSEEIEIVKLKQPDKNIFRASDQQEKEKKKEET